MADKIELASQEKSDLRVTSWRPHMCQFFREAILRITRQELARILQVTPESITKWEDPKNGQPPNRYNLEKLCQVFNCEMFELYSDFNPDDTREFLKDIFKTWSFVLQQCIRSKSSADKTLALKLTNLFMEYDEKRRVWEIENPTDVISTTVEDELNQIMFGDESKEIPEFDSENEDEPEIEEGDEEDALIDESNALGL